MKRYTINTICACILMAGATCALAEDRGGITWSVDGGVNFLPQVSVSSSGAKANANFDPGFRIGGSGIYTIQPAEAKQAGFGIGVDAGFLYNEVKHSSDAWLGQVPVLAKFVMFSDPTRLFQVNFGAGAGVAWTHIDTGSHDDNDISPAWGAEVGVRYALADNSSIGLLGKYTGVDSPTYKMGGGKFDVDTLHNFSVGLVFTTRF